MEQSERIMLIRQIAKGLAKLLGPSTEIAVHDLEKGEIVAIENASVTGRSIGYHMSPSVFDTILSHVDEADHLIGYGSHSAQGKRLRSSHFIFRDDAQKPCALMCINQDISKFEEFSAILSAMIRINPLCEQEDGDPQSENYIQKMTQQVILDAIGQAKPTSLDNKDAKIQILQKLEQRGVFAVKDAVPTVCQLLSISQATLYNYLREIRIRETISHPADPFLEI